MNNRLVPKKISRIQEHGRTIDLGSSRDSSGFGHVIVPFDIDREEYIRKVYDTGKCILVSTYDDPIRNVVLVNHLIQQIKFPQSPGERGSLVFWSSVPGANDIIALGIINQEDEFNSSKELTISHINKYLSYTLADITSAKTNSKVISITDSEGEDGSIVIKATGEKFTNTISILTNGKLKIESDSEIELFAEDAIKIQLGSGDGEISTLDLTKDGVLSYRDKDNNEFSITELGFKIENSNESLSELFIDLLTMYMDTKTIDGKVLDPSSLTEAADLMSRFKSLII